MSQTSDDIPRRLCHRFHAGHGLLAELVLVVVSRECGNFIPRTNEHRMQRDQPCLVGTVQEQGLGRMDLCGQGVGGRINLDRCGK